jgi:hypothetical protein
MVFLPSARRMDAIRANVTKAFKREHMLLAFSVLIANVMTEPVSEDLKATFGTAVWEHPATVWAVLIALVWINTGNFGAGLVLVLMYEATKFAWRLIRPDPPHIAQVQRLVNRMRLQKELDDEDIRFIDRITPDNVTFSKQQTPVVPFV